MSVDGLFDADGYRTLSSDIVAHLVFTHQIGMTNLLTRAGWQARVADPALHPPYSATPGEEERIALMMKGVAGEIVDHLLFIDEAPLTDAVRGQSGFAERFATSGPRDRQGRSLYQLDLSRRVDLRDAADAVAAARLAIIEILRDTKKDLPSYFHGPIK